MLGCLGVHGRSTLQSALSMASADAILPAHGFCLRVVQKRRGGTPSDEWLCCRPSPYCGNCRWCEDRKGAAVRPAQSAAFAFSLARQQGEGGTEDGAVD